jgi:hypothetical protein
MAMQKRKMGSYFAIRRHGSDVDANQDYPEYQAECPSRKAVCPVLQHQLQSNQVRGRRNSIIEPVVPCEGEAKGIVDKTPSPQGLAGGGRGFHFQGHPTHPANVQKLPATGIKAAISPKLNIVRKTMAPTIRYAIRTDAGPPVARDFPVPRNRPVPIVPPMAIICT